MHQTARRTGLALLGTSLLVLTLAWGCGRSEEAPEPAPTPTTPATPATPVTPATPAKAPDPAAPAPTPEKVPEPEKAAGPETFGVPERPGSFAKGAPVFALWEFSEDSWKWSHFDLHAECKTPVCKVQWVSEHDVPAAFIIPVDTNAPITKGAIVFADAGGYGASAGIVEAISGEEFEVRWIGPYMLDNPALEDSPTSKVKRHQLMPRPEGIAPLAPVAYRHPGEGWLYREVVAVFNDKALVFGPLAGRKGIAVVAQSELRPISSKARFKTGQTAFGIWGPLYMRKGTVTKVEHGGAVISVDYSPLGEDRVGVGGVIDALPE